MEINTQKRICASRWSFTKNHYMVHGQQNIKFYTYIVFSNFLSQIVLVYEIKWKTMLETDRPQMTTWRMRISCWITKATDTHSEYVIFFRFQNSYPNAPHCYVTLTLSLPKYTNDRRGLQRPRQSMYILNTDQFAGHYCNTLRHSYRYRSLLTALQLLERKSIILN